MKSIFFVSYFLIVLIFSTVNSEAQNANQHSNGLIFDFIERNSNFSVDPCTDFAAHMCPEGGMNFRDVVEKRYDEIWKIQNTSDHRLKHIWIENDQTQMTSEMDIMKKMLKNGSSTILKICSMSQSGRAACYNTAKMFDDKDEAKVNLTTSCEELSEFLKTNFSDSEMKSAYTTVIRGAVGIAVHDYIQNKTRRFHQLFYDIKNEFIELLKETPYLTANNLTNKFLEKLNEVTINDLGTMIKPLETAILEFDRSFKTCVQHNSENNMGFKVLCKFSAIRIASEIMAENSLFGDEMFMESAADSIGNIYNVNDGVIFFGNHAELLVYSDMVPAFYGLLGFLMSHELMHTFTFDENDTSDLRFYWTNETECITQQTINTCENYGVPCGNSSQTFEEDAADFNGIRLAWQVYQKQKKAMIEKTGRFAVQRKKIIENAFEINDDQLFFYAAGLFLCDGEYRANYSAENLSKRDHTLAYIRMNNIASQMDQFHQAFKCKKEDLIVKNKVSDCVQYGVEAPKAEVVRGL